MKKKAVVMVDCVVCVSLNGRIAAACGCGGKKTDHRPATVGLEAFAPKKTSRRSKLALKKTKFENMQVSAMGVGLEKVVRQGRIRSHGQERHLPKHTRTTIRGADVRVAGSKVITTLVAKQAKVPYTTYLHQQ